MDLSQSIFQKLPQTTLFQKVGEICAGVNTVTRPHELLEVSLRNTLELFKASRGSIFILNENGRDLVLKESQGMARNEQEEMVKQMGEGIVGQVAKLKKPVYVGDIGEDQRFRNYKARGSYRTSSFICAPLIIKDQLIGVINITDKESGGRFDEDEVLLLDFLATQIALNYRRIQLYQKFKSIVKETQDLKTKLGQSDQEAEYLRRQVNIQEKLATIGKLAGGIAHEFNNPLDGVIRYTNLCLEQAKDDEILKGYLLEIKHGLNRMANIVKNLLACSRNEQFSQEKISFQEALDHALSGINLDLSSKKISVKTDIDPGLPMFRDLGLERIVTNLIRNASDAMEENGALEIKAGVKDNSFVFVVTDTGKGIEEDLVNKIFEPFFTTKDSEKGCGLGLTIVGEVVKNYDGKIDVSSRVNKGTQFVVSLPLEKCT